MIHILTGSDFFEILVHPLDALLLGESHIHLAPSVLRHRIGHRAAADDAGIDRGTFFVVRFLLDVEDFVGQLLYRASAVLGIVSRVSPHAGDLEHVLRHALALDDDAIILETGFQVESHEGAFRFLLEIRRSVRFPMGHFLITGENNFQRVLIIACFGEEFHSVEKNGDAALHIQDAWACHLAIGHSEGTSRRGAVSKNGIHVTGEDHEGLRHVPLLGDEHISCLFIFMETDRETEACEELFDILPDCIDASLISGPAVSVHQSPPGLHHSGFIFIDLCEKRLYVLHVCLLLRIGIWDMDAFDCFAIARSLEPGAWSLYSVQ